MRLVCRSSDREYCEKFYRFLVGEGIEGVYETGAGEHEVWVVYEDDYAKAHDWYIQYKQEPHDPRFASGTQELILEWMPSRKKKLEQHVYRPSRVADSEGRITTFIFFLCVTLFIWGLLLAVGEGITGSDGHGPTTHPIRRVLMFDYPDASRLADELSESFTINELNRPSELPPEAREKWQALSQTPIWMGIYPRLVALLRGESVNLFGDASLMERIRDGEVWRLLTPVFLHDMPLPLHIFFNMIWLMVLGKQMEARLGPARYITFIILAGVFSNVAQYVVGGHRFLGYSGVICAMLAFIATRRKRSPWEGYILQPGTLVFVSAFVLLFALMQTYSFILEVQNGVSSVPGTMANTAHLAGALAGWVMARTDMFKSSY